MSKLEECLQKQDDIAVALQRSISSFKKTAKDRRTLEFVERKINEIDEYWKAFDKWDNVIRQHPSMTEEHNYIKANIHGALGEKYNDARDQMVTWLQLLKAKDATDRQEVGPSTQASTQTALLIAKQKRLTEMLLNTLTKLLSDTNVHPRQYYDTKIPTLERHFKNIQDLHKRIWNSLETVDDTTYDLNQYSNIEEDISNKILKLQLMAGSRISASSNVEANQNAALPLPKIELPKFSGQYLYWRQFRDLFTELVHNQPIPTCPKMWYLKTVLTGEAAGLIQHFTSTEANYEQAWKIINDRYENPRLLVDTVIAKLLSQPANQQETVASIKMLHDTTVEGLRSLESLGVNTQNWDPLLLYVLVNRLSKYTHTLWEQSIVNPRQPPTLKEFTDFLERRFQTLESLGANSKKSEISKQPYTCKSLTVSIAPKTCIICKNQHPLFTCNQFLQMTPKSRLSSVQKAMLCVNCLKSGHSSKDCLSRCCIKCNKRHNTLLHLGNEATKSSNVQNINDKPKGTSLRSHASIPASTSTYGSSPAISLSAVPIIPTNYISGTTKTTLLSTIQLKVRDNWGQYINCRAVLDSGSQANFITKHLATKLGMRKIPHFINIEGIGETRRCTTNRINIQITSRTTEFSTRIEAQILHKIVSNQPTQAVDTEGWPIPKNLPLADPQFSMPASIDLLIGAGLFYNILCVGQIKLGTDLPVLQNTLFGWVIGGEFNNNNCQISKVTCGISSETELNEAVERFWRIEECDARSDVLTSSEKRCIQHYNQNVQRHCDGRYIVRLPFEGEPSQLGDSRHVALQRFRSIERKFERDDDFKQLYVQFMREYETLGHMKKVNPDEIERPYFFLPHHGVFKPDSSSTKLRVVFDASAKTSSNYSLNDVLSTGPNMQADLFTVLLRFRLPKYVFTTDIEKMYRKIWVHPSDRKYQLIFWREKQSLPLKCYQLNTVTYGTTCAPFLAIRSLQHLAEQNSDKYPLASEAIKNNFYVDDGLCGSDSLIVALDTQAQLINMLQTAGYNLRKWCSNDKRLLQNVPSVDKTAEIEFKNKDEESTKAMGLTWNPVSDTFSVRTGIMTKERITKRTALSAISRIFDPLGFIAPVVVSAKIFLQELWRLKLDWDAAIPQNLHTFWENYKNKLPELEKISIQRHLLSHQASKNFQVHIFADASEQAYGAVSYIRSIDGLGTIRARFLCAKSRVAPVKQISLPRLELCAAKLAVDLMKRIQQDLNINKEKIYLWTDSTAVLGWVNASSANYHTFVANRVASIQRNTLPEQWRHVQSHQNPADIVSRGVTPDKIAANSLWFYGPMFLHGSEGQWPSQSAKHEECYRAPQ